MVLGFNNEADPATKAWLRSSMDDVFGLPSLARFSWGTVKTLFKESGVQIEWFLNVCFRWSYTAIGKLMRTRIAKIVTRGCF